MVVVVSQASRGVGTILVPHLSRRVDKCPLLDWVPHRAARGCRAAKTPSIGEDPDELRTHDRAVRTERPPEALFPMQSVNSQYRLPPAHANVAILYFRRSEFWTHQHQRCTSVLALLLLALRIPVRCAAAAIGRRRPPTAVLVIPRKGPPRLQHVRIFPRNQGSN